MELGAVKEAITQLEKANADLEPDLLSAQTARDLMASYARAEKLAAYGKTLLASKLEDVGEVARLTGTSMGKATAAVETAEALRHADEVRDAFKAGAISLDQAQQIARAEQASPGAASELLQVADNEAFHVLKDKARKIVLESEQHRDLATRQHEARRAGSHRDELGMVHIHMELEPHVGAPIANRAEAEAARLYRKAKQEQCLEPFERYLADAYAALLQGAGKGTSKRPELVILVSHEVARRGWKDVQPGEMCKIPGLGPVAPEIAKQIASDAFLTGVFYDGKDLRNICRWTRNTPIEVRLALELGEPKEFDGIRCVDCGNRFRNEKDHVEPHVAFGPASTTNLVWRCNRCHKVKTEKDRRAGKLRPRTPMSQQGPPLRC